jgi:hypothetical protein
MKLNEKANELTDLEKNVLYCFDAEGADEAEEPRIISNYTEAKGKVFSAVCSSLCQKGLLAKFDGMLFLTSKLIPYLDASETRKVKMIHQMGM